MKKRIIKTIIGILKRVQSVWAPICLVLALPAFIYLPLIVGVILCIVGVGGFVYRYVKG